MRDMGRPSTYTPEIAAKICERLAAGESLRAICRDEGMPDRSTVMDWVNQNLQGFSDQYVRAREEGFDTLAEEALQIADTPQQGVRRETSEDGVKEIREDMLGHRKLQVETRLRLLSKWAPKKYGDRQDINLTGQVDLATSIIAARRRAGG